MARVAHITRAFNAGELSVLMEGRNDYERFPLSMRRAYNGVGVAQGPFCGRSGTEFLWPQHDEANAAALRPFTFSDDESFVLEFGERYIEFGDENGLLVRPAVAVTAVSALPGSLILTAPGHATSAGDRVVLDGFPTLQGQAAKIIGVAGDQIELEWPNGLAYSIAFASGMAVKPVYRIASPYAAADAGRIYTVPSTNTIYLFCDGYRPQKLVRAGVYDWRINAVEFLDGPFGPVNNTATKIAADVRGNVPTTTADGTAFADTGTAARAFDDAAATEEWHASSPQAGILGFEFNAPTRVSSYVIYPSVSSTSADYSALDYAPSTWTFEASNDGSTYVVLDEVRNYVLWDNSKSVAFNCNNEDEYLYYRLNITAVKRNGPLAPRIKRLVFGPKDPATITLTASALTGINEGQGFLSTDAGRQIRLLSSDDIWRPLTITAVLSTTQVEAHLQGRDPLYSTDATQEWRLGDWSDTTGWPTCGHFAGDRLWSGGARLFPDTFAASVVGNYERFSPTTEGGEVLDDSGLRETLNARKVARIAWIDSDEKGVLIGTGSQEWVVTAANREGVITARSRTARASTERGSQAGIQPVKVDRQLLFVQRGRRTLREFAYTYTADGYRAPTLTQLASHIPAKKFEQVEYTAEPHPILWARRADGLLGAFIYDREQNVMGWHVVELPGGFVESLTTIPAKDGLSDILFLTVRRTINGRTRRYVERLMPWWDFDFTVEANAHYVDAGLRYIGAPVATLYGLGHLEGQTVVGLVDGGVFTPRVVSGGAIDVSDSVDMAAASVNIVVGLPFDTEGTIQRPEAGSQTGTAQTKIKKYDRVAARVWDTGGGEIGWEAGAVFGKQSYPAEENFTPVVARAWDDPVAKVPLYTGDVVLKGLDAPFDSDGTITFRRPGNQPLPFNLVALVGHLDTEDA